MRTFHQFAGWLIIITFFVSPMPAEAVPADYYIRNCVLITLSDGTLIDWQYALQSQVVIDSLRFKSEEFKNFLKSKGIVRVLKWFPDISPYEDSYFTARNGNVLNKRPWAREYTFYLSSPADDSLLAELTNRPEIIRASFNQQGVYYAEPRDSLYEVQTWPFDKIEAQDAWDTAKGDNIRIAIIDQGAD